MKVLVAESHLTDIANAIRYKLRGSDTYRPGDMAEAIESIEGGYPEPTGTLPITSNGTVNVKDYASANVNVPNSYAAEDEGKVVSSGALVAQTSQTVTQNGTYDTTLINELIANISGGGGGISYGKAIPDASAGAEGDIYLQISEAAVKNTAGQYISTGYSGNENSKYVIAFMLTKAQSSQWPTPFGARTGDVTNASLYSLAISESNYSQSSAQWGNTNTIATGFPGATALVNKMVVLEVAAGSEKMVVDGVAYTHTSTHSGTVNGTSSMGIFATLKNEGYQSWSPVDGMMLFGFDIYESDALVHSYRPAKDASDVVCLYDSIDQQYLYHSGGGTLQYIEEGTIVKVYLKQNGVWINAIGATLE